MGRPKKEEAKVKPEDADAVETVADGGVPYDDMVNMPNTPPVDLKHLKECPKCGEKCTGPYKDKHGLYRCNCSHPKCGFWDSVVSEAPEEAARLWQLAGGPNPSME